ncbi:hypothetical protein DOTSEDRAFT_27811 [Dothistroma septosporum NZE10]|uniref:Uncharacterized protein n=1 Tax=Dothistroma septosporum (strain NZE10 / CBS 128990) TaxID=675120 RepID=N1PE52_DOTSN|nr:hypothetical protein DOTSEDRAFT_27811 [Dothistroma septosporum NZE10]
MAYSNDASTVNWHKPFGDLTYRQQNTQEALMQAIYKVWGVDTRTLLPLKHRPLHLPTAHFDQSPPFLRQPTRLAEKTVNDLDLAHQYLETAALAARPQG